MLCKSDNVTLCTILHLQLTRCTVAKLMVTSTALNNNTCCAATKKSNRHIVCN